MMEVMGVIIDAGFRQLGLLGEQATQPTPAGTVTAPGTRPAPRR
jgi:biopolymer transport protein TolR